MKMLQWLRLFEEAGQRLLSVAELAKGAGETPHRTNAELGRLVKRGLIARYARGHYGRSGGVSLEELATAIDPGAYITGLYALFRRGMVAEAPKEATCFTKRRQRVRTNRVTPAGRLRFVRVPAQIYCRPKGEALAPAAQALCELAWLTVREGGEVRPLVPFEELRRVGPATYGRTVRRYSARVRKAVDGMVAWEQPDWLPMMCAAVGKALRRRTGKGSGGGRPGGTGGGGESATLMTRIRGGWLTRRTEGNEEA